MPEAGAAALDAALRAGPTATAVLERWCARHGLVVGVPRIRVVLVETGRGEMTVQRSALLKLRTGEDVRYRLVRLCCDDLVLARAHCWFVPQRLDPAMNVLLEEGQEPLGRIVAPLAPWRRPLASRLPDPSRGDVVLEHHALLMAGEGLPLAEVLEHYLAPLLPRTA